MADCGWDGHGSVWRSKKVAELRSTKSGAGLAVGWWDGSVGGQGSNSSKCSDVIIADSGFSGKKIFKFFRFFVKNFYIKYRNMIFKDKN